jgi:transposase
MSKLLKHFVGIDISKLFFDVALLKAGGPGNTEHQQFNQSLQGFIEMKQWLEKQGVYFNEETLVCMEYTGMYNTALVNYLCEEKALVWVEMALRIKKSQGFERSSDDKTDAIKIARYAYRHQDNKQLWSPTDKSLVKIKHLIAQRDRLVDAITRLSVPLKELKEIGCIDEAVQMERLQKPVINNLEKAKHKIEDAIMSIVNENKELLHKVNTIKSIKGIGEVTAVAFLVYTKGFTCFRNAKELACYCGVAPFIKKKSGISIKSKPGVSPFANKKLKWLLHLCALSAIRNDTQIKTYYERKVAEGKNKMSVINAVRNKLVLRMFAVLRDDRSYVENYQRKCA